MRRSERLVRALQAVQGAGRSSESSRAVAAGLREGLKHARGGRAPLRWPELPPDDTSAEQSRHGAVLAGHLLGSLESFRRGSHESVLAGATYAAALATPQGQRALGDLSPSALLKAHVFACIIVERRGQPLAEAQEVELFSWLHDQAGVPEDPSDRDGMLRKRARRRERQP